MPIPSSEYSHCVTATASAAGTSRSRPIQNHTADNTGTNRPDTHLDSIEEGPTLVDNSHLPCSSCVKLQQLANQYANSIASYKDIHISSMNENIKQYKKRLGEIVSTFAPHNEDLANTSERSLPCISCAYKAKVYQYEMLKAQSAAAKSGAEALRDTIQNELHPYLMFASQLATITDQQQEHQTPSDATPDSNSEQFAQQLEELNRSMESFYSESERPQLDLSTVMYISELVNYMTSQYSSSMDPQIEQSDVQLSILSAQHEIDLATESTQPGDNKSQQTNNINTDLILALADEYLSELPEIPSFDINCHPPVQESPCVKPRNEDQPIGEDVVTGDGNEVPDPAYMALVQQYNELLACYNIAVARLTELEQEASCQPSSPLVNAASDEYSRSSNHHEQSTIANDVNSLAYQASLIQLSYTQRVDEKKRKCWTNCFVISLS
eukprot:UN02722